MIASLRESYGRHVTKLASSNERIIMLEGDLADSTQSEPFQIKYPDRHFQIGIAEQNMVGMAAGLAYEGKLPIVNSFAAFIAMRACEQVRTDIAYPNLNVKLVVSHSGLSAGTAGPTHHTVEDIGIMRSIPNMKVLVPGDAVEVEQVIESALETNGPVYIRISAIDTRTVMTESKRFKIGKGTVISDGDDLTIFTTGTMVDQGLSVCEELQNKHNIFARLVQMASIKPLDKEIIEKAIDKQSPIISIEEHNIIGGLGSAVAEVIAEYGKACSFHRIGILDRFSPITGNPPYLFKSERIDEDSILKMILQII